MGVQGTVSSPKTPKTPKTNFTFANQGMPRSLTSCALSLAANRHVAFSAAAATAASRTATNASRS